MQPPQEKLLGHQAPLSPVPTLRATDVLDGAADVWRRGSVREACSCVREACSCVREACSCVRAAWGQREGYVVEVWRQCGRQSG